MVNPKTQADRVANKNASELAEKIRIKRAFELSSESHGIISSEQQNADFLHFFNIFIQSYSKKDKRMFIAAHNKFKYFVMLKMKRDNLPAKLVTEKFLTEFREFLEREHKGETPHDYFSKLKRVIKKAIKEGLFRTALELLFNWLIIESNPAMTSAQRKIENKKNAAEKVRVLLKNCNVGLTVPLGLPALAQHLQTDGPETFTTIRNSLVYTNKNKRGKLVNWNAQTRYEALQLGIWYVEVIVLHKLDHSGYYSNRCNHFNSRIEKVPWA